MGNECGPLNEIQRSQAPCALQTFERITRKVMNTLGQNFLHHMPMHIGETEVTTGITEGQLLMIQA